MFLFLGRGIILSNSQSETVAKCPPHFFGHFLKRQSKFFSPFSKIIHILPSKSLNYVCVVSCFNINTNKHKVKRVCKIFYKLFCGFDLGVNIDLSDGLLDFWRRIQDRRWPGIVQVLSLNMI